MPSTVLEIFKYLDQSHSDMCVFICKSSSGYTHKDSAFYYLLPIVEKGKKKIGCPRQ